MRKGINSSFFENWTKTTLENVEKNSPDMPYYQRVDIMTSCELLRCCNNSLDLLKDAGFESSLKYLAKKCTELSQVSQYSCSNHSLSTFETLHHYCV